MKRTLTFSAALLLLTCLASAGQENPSGTVSYALPQTSLTFDVEAVRESFFAGPYAKFAEKYLGIAARQEDGTTFQISSIKMTPHIEADPQRRYVVTLPQGGSSAFLQLTAQGLVATSDGSFGHEAVWRFPTTATGDFSGKGVNSNLSSESATLLQSVKAEDQYNKVSVSQSMVVAKSLEQKAQEAAEMILDLRRTRVEIITGDTDANYSGESMGSAIAEIARLEQEYLTLFTGYSEFQTQRMSFDVVPTSDISNHVYVAFRLSDAHGLVTADDMSGKPYIVDIATEGLSAANGAGASQSKGNLVHYRTPAICNVKLTDGVNMLLQARVPIYQYGIENTYPISNK